MDLCSCRCVPPMDVSLNYPPADQCQKKADRRALISVFTYLLSICFGGLTIFDENLAALAETQLAIGECLSLPAANMDQ